MLEPSGRHSCIPSRLARASIPIRCASLLPSLSWCDPPPCLDPSRRWGGISLAIFGDMVDIPGLVSRVPRALGIQQAKYAMNQGHMPPPGHRSAPTDSEAGEDRPGIAAVMPTTVRSSVAMSISVFANIEVSEGFEPPCARGEPRTYVGRSSDSVGITRGQASTGKGFLIHHRTRISRE